MTPLRDALRCTDHVKFDRRVPPYGTARGAYLRPIAGRYTAGMCRCQPEQVIDGFTCRYPD